MASSSKTNNDTNQEEVVQPVLSTGSSSGWRQKKKQALNIFAEFCAKQKYSVKWQSMDAKFLCVKKLWELFGGFLVRHYKKKVVKKGGSKTLGLRSALNVFSSMMWQAKTQCFNKERKANEKKVSAETELFFTCLHSKSQSEQAEWLRGVRDNMVRILFSQAMKNSEIINHQVPPVYRKQVQLMNEILTDNGFVFKSALSKLTFTCLRMTAGRTAEISWLLLETFRWDPYYLQVFVDVRRKYILIHY